MVFLLQALRPMSQALASQRGLTLMVLAIAERLWVNAEAEMTVSVVLPVLDTESPESLIELSPAKCSCNILTKGPTGARQAEAILSVHLFQKVIVTILSFP